MPPLAPLALPDGQPPERGQLQGAHHGGGLRLHLGDRLGARGGGENRGTAGAAATAAGGGVHRRGRRGRRTGRAARRRPPAPGASTAPFAAGGGRGAGRGGRRQPRAGTAGEERPRWGEAAGRPVGRSSAPLRESGPRGAEPSPRAGAAPLPFPPSPLCGTRGPGPAARARAAPEVRRRLRRGGARPRPLHGAAAEGTGSAPEVEASPVFLLSPPL